MGTLSSGHKDTESSSSTNNQDSNEATNGFKTKMTKNDSMSAIDLRDIEDISPYTD